jgi:hypothetical protein
VAEVPRKRKLLIGWREQVALPELDIPALTAKIDTGALTSTLDAENIEPFTEGGVAKVRFVFHPVPERPDPALLRCAEIVDRRTVTDSGMHRELRYVIRTCIAMGADAWPIELTLANRRGMRFRLLLGRRALRGRFVVDPATSFRLGHAPGQGRADRPSTAGEQQ